MLVVTGRSGRGRKNAPNGRAARASSSLRLRARECTHQAQSAASSRAEPPTEPTTAPMIMGVWEVDPEEELLWPEVALDPVLVFVCVPVPEVGPGVLPAPLVPEVPALLVWVPVPVAYLDRSIIPSTTISARDQKTRTVPVLALLVLVVVAFPPPPPSGVATSKYTSQNTNP